MNNLKELFKTQLIDEPGESITEETFNKLHSKTYFSGNPVKIGDQVLFGLFVDKENDEIYEKNNESSDISLRLILLCEDEFDLYEEHSLNKRMENKGHKVMPVLKLKKNE